MDDKLMYIPNGDIQNYSFFILKLLLKHLNTQLNEETNQNSKFPKLLNHRKRKCCDKTLGTSGIKCRISPPSLARKTLPESIMRSDVATLQLNFTQISSYGK